MRSVQVYFLLCCFSLLMCGGAFKHIMVQRLVRRSTFQLSMGRAAAVRAETKTRQDSAKANANSKYAKRILAAIKTGGSVDPSQNAALAIVIAEARARNIPKDVIQRNIDKAKEGITEDYKQLLLEYYGPGGCGILVNVLTDNANRARGDLNIVLKKHALKAANSNAVACKFDLKARFDISTKIPEDQLVEICLECGVEDYQLFDTVSDCPLNPQTEGHCSIYVKINDVGVFRDALSRRGVESVCILQHVPNSGWVTLNDADFDASMSAIAAIESVDDVDSVEHNIDMTSDWCN